MRLALFIVCLFFVACSSESGEQIPMPTDLEPGCPPDAQAECDSATGRAILCGRFECDAAPEAIRIEQGDSAYEIFTYEASHPLATAERAFPCAASQGERFEAPDGPTQACSTPGVRPWHSVRWTDANDACESIGWRLCTGAELERACGGPSFTAYTFGPVFESGVCNIREAYRGSDTPFASVAPTGHFDECVSAEGAFDLTGNLWEWISDAPDNDSTGHIYQGAGWKTIAERHRDINQVCSEQTQLMGTNGESFTGPFVGFRCCRDAN